VISFFPMKQPREAWKMREITLVIAILLGAATVGAGELDPLDALAQSTSRKPADLVALGDLYVEALRLTEARRAYKEALSKKPDYGEAKMGLARIQIALGKFGPAKHACKKLATTYKKKSVSEVCSGWFWLSKDRSARAVDEFEKAIKKGDLARGKTGMGEVMRRRSEYDAAIAAYEEALGAGAGHRAQIGLGLTLEIMGKKDEATRAFAKAASMQGASCLARYHHGRMLAKGDLAVAQLNAAIAIRGGWADAYLALGNAHFQNGKYPEAIDAYEKAIADAQGMGSAYLGLGKALHKTGNLKAARDALRKAAELIPDLREAYRILADIEYALGNHDGALAALDRMRNLSPEDVSVYLHCGKLTYEMKRFTQARSFLGQAVSMKPTLSEAHLLLGNIACERRLYRAGQESYKLAVAGDMANVEQADIDKRIAGCVPGR
jgi:tetratricopeptide (TPR) repeat protein